MVTWISADNLYANRGLTKMVSLLADLTELRLTKYGHNDWSSILQQQENSFQTGDNKERGLESRTSHSLEWHRLIFGLQPKGKDGFDLLFWIWAGTKSAFQILVNARISKSTSPSFFPRSPNLATRVGKIQVPLYFSYFHLILSPFFCYKPTSASLSSIPVVNWLCIHPVQKEKLRLLHSGLRDVTVY